MRLLLDTHALVWWVSDPDQISVQVREEIEDADEVWVSAVSAYEMSLKFHHGRLSGVAALLPRLTSYLEEQKFRPLALTIAHADRAGRLPREHRDPFDRMLIAQALVDDLTLVSNEEPFDQFGVRRFW